MIYSLFTGILMYLGKSCFQFFYYVLDYVANWTSYVLCRKYNIIIFVLIYIYLQHKECNQT